MKKAFLLHVLICFISYAYAYDAQRLVTTYGPQALTELIAAAGQDLIRDNTDMDEKSRELNAAYGKRAVKKFKKMQKNQPSQLFDCLEYIGAAGSIDFAQQIIKNVHAVPKLQQLASKDPHVRINLLAQELFMQGKCSTGFGTGVLSGKDTKNSIDFLAETMLMLNVLALSKINK